MSKLLQAQLGALGLIVILAGCNSGASGNADNTSVSVLTSYPTSGNYIGSATSSKGYGKGVAKGSVSGANANFNVVADAIGTIQGTFQLNNSTCFLGSETFGDSFPVTKSFVATNCSYSNGVFRADYENGFGDKGTLTMTLQ